MKKKYFLSIILLAFIGCSKDITSLEGESIEKTSPMLKSAIIGTPCPGDFDGDGMADLAIVTGEGAFYIDFKSTEFGSYEFYREDLTIYSTGGTILINDFDGDGKDDYFFVYGNGFRYDRSGNGFGQLDETEELYSMNGNLATGDYDGDGLADWSYKNSSGTWYIDYADGGFGNFNNSWGDEAFNGYSSSPIASGDFDGDGISDLSVKTDGGRWYIDYSNDGFGSWDVYYSSYGGNSTLIASADYDGDGTTDLSVKANDGTGRWLIDYAENGFGTWDYIRTGCFGSGIPFPKDYDGDGSDDICFAYGSSWYIDYSSNGFGDALVVVN